MKTALDFYERGKQKEANADEYDRSRYYSKDKFICPECGEAVHLTEAGTVIILRILKRVKYLQSVIDVLTADQQIQCMKG